MLAYLGNSTMLDARANGFCFIATEIEVTVEMVEKTKTNRG